MGLVEAHHPILSSVVGTPASLKARPTEIGKPTWEEGPSWVCLTEQPARQFVVRWSIEPEISRVDPVLIVPWASSSHGRRIRTERMMSGQNLQYEHREGEIVRDTGAAGCRSARWPVAIRTHSRRQRGPLPEGSSKLTIKLGSWLAEAPGIYINEPDPPIPRTDEQVVRLEISHDEPAGVDEGY
jgi:hypothetical protein